MFLLLLFFLIESISAAEYCLYRPENVSVTWYEVTTLYDSLCEACRPLVTVSSGPPPYYEQLSCDAPSNIVYDCTTSAPLLPSLGHLFFSATRKYAGEETVWTGTGPTFNHSTCAFGTPFEFPYGGASCLGKRGVLCLCQGRTIATASPTSKAPTTGSPTSKSPTTGSPTTGSPTTRSPTTESPTTGVPTTGVPTTAVPTTGAPTTGVPTTESPTEEESLTESPSLATTETPTVEATETPTVETTEAPTETPTVSPTYFEDATTEPTFSPTPMATSYVMFLDKNGFHHFLQVLNVTGWSRCYDTRSEDVCETGCLPTQAHEDESITCGTNGTHTYLREMVLSRMGLNGQLPLEALRTFQHLVKLDLSNDGLGEEGVNNTLTLPENVTCVDLPYCYEPTTTCLFPDGIELCTVAATSTSYAALGYIAVPFIGLGLILVVRRSRKTELFKRMSKRFSLRGGDDPTVYKQKEGEEIFVREEYELPSGERHFQVITPTGLKYDHLENPHVALSPSAVRQPPLHPPALPPPPPPSLSTDEPKGIFSSLFQRKSSSTLRKTIVTKDTGEEVQVYDV